MIKDILVLGHPILTVKSFPATHTVNGWSDETMQICRDLFDTIRSTKNAIGLAAPQIGYSRNIFATHFHQDSIYPIVHIEPQILKRSKTTNSMIEGCLSIPNDHYVIERHDAILVKYFVWAQGERTFHEVVRKLDGVKARVFQHEYDHLQGKLIWPYEDLYE